MEEHAPFRIIFTHLAQQQSKNPPKVSENNTWIKPNSFYDLSLEVVLPTVKPRKAICCFIIWPTTAFLS